MKKRILGISSDGGHSIQLKLILLPITGDAEVHIFTTSKAIFSAPNFITDESLTDFSRQDLYKAPLSLYQNTKKILAVKPDLVVSTGALPGTIAIICARLLGVKTLWVDSIANTKKLSLSGKIAKHFAHKTLSQWPDVAANENVKYEGALL